MDLVSVLNLYDSHSKTADVEIIVSGTKANATFLEEAGVNKDKISFLSYKTNVVKREVSLLRYIRDLYQEREKLNEVVKAITKNSRNKLYFHSYNFDIYAGYLVAKVAKTNQVTLVDVLQLRSTPIAIKDLTTITGLKLIGLLNILRLIFGNIYFISGTRGVPMISLDLSNINMKEDKFKFEKIKQKILKKYGYNPAAKIKNAVIYLYGEPDGIPFRELEHLQHSVLECLTSYNFSVFIKRHPQSDPIKRRKRYIFQEIPSYIPFEFINLSHVSIVIGWTGASLLATGKIPTISLFNLAYTEDSPYYSMIKRQLKKNPNLLYVSSIEELQSLINNLELKT